MGDHIASLLIRFFILYCPYLIEAGKVYKAMPPLYMVPDGKKKKYFLNNAVMAKENQKIFKKTYTISDGKNVLPDKVVEDMVVRNSDYVYELESSASNHGVSPKLLEIVLINYIKNGDIKSLENMIKKNYRFVKFSKIKQIEKIEVSDDALYTIYYTKELFADCKRIIRIMNSNDKLIYTVNNEPMTIYHIMKAFDSIMPNGYKRYKGLGETNWTELEESTVNSNSRSLIQYTVEDAKEEIERIRRIESDKKQIFQFYDRIDRSMLIGI